MGIEISCFGGVLLQGIVTVENYRRSSADELMKGWRHLI